MGLGSASLVTLALARQEAVEARRLLMRGVDPIDARQVVEEAASAEEANARVNTF